MKTQAVVTIQKQDNGKYRFICDCSKKITTGEANTLKEVFLACTRIVEEIKASHKDVEERLNGLAKSYSEKPV